MGANLSGFAKKPTQPTPAGKKKGGGIAPAAIFAKPEGPIGSVFVTVALTAFAGR